MNPLLMFALEMATSLACSGMTAAVLTRPLHRVLTDTCGTPERAHFWVAYCDVMLFLAPLVATVALGKSGQVPEPTVAYFKAALGSALFGVFVALAAIGIQVARFLPARKECGNP